MTAYEPVGGVFGVCSFLIWEHSSTDIPSRSSAFYGGKEGAILRAEDTCRRVP